MHRTFKHLIRLLNIYNPTGKEKKLRRYIVKVLKQNKIDYKIDYFGNIYSFQYKNKPFLSAHLDSVKTEEDNTIKKNMKITQDLIWSEGNIIGADDLVGVYIILHLLITTNIRFNWVLTTEEESGLYGSIWFANKNPELIENSLYGIVIDRKGGNEIICCENNYGTKELEEDVLKAVPDFKSVWGMGSDADTWSVFISCINISCGYYRHHTKSEYIKISEVSSTIKAVKKILRNVKKKYEKLDMYENHFYHELRRKSDEKIEVQSKKPAIAQI